MRKILLAILLLAVAPVHAAEVAGVKVEETTRSGAATLALNGAGLRTRAFFRSMCGLYLPEKKAAAADVLASNGPKRVLIQMLRDVDADDFSEALEPASRITTAKPTSRGLRPASRR